MIEALKNNKNIIGLTCASYDIFSVGECNENRAYPILNDDDGVKGEYYFATLDKSPYIKSGVPKQDVKDERKD